MKIKTFNIIKLLIVTLLMLTYIYVCNSQLKLNNPTLPLLLLFVMGFTIGFKVRSDTVDLTQIISLLLLLVAGIALLFPKLPIIELFSMHLIGSAIHTIVFLLLGMNLAYVLSENK